MKRVYYNIYFNLYQLANIIETKNGYEAPMPHIMAYIIFSILIGLNLITALFSFNLMFGWEIVWGKGEVGLTWVLVMFGNYLGILRKSRYGKSLLEYQNRSDRNRKNWKKVTYLYVVLTFGTLFLLIYLSSLKS